LYFVNSNPEHMDVSLFMRKYSEELGVQYTEYSPEHSIIIVPVSGGRYQTVIGTVRQSELYNRPLLGFQSKVCPVQAGIDWQMLLEQTSYFSHSRFIIADNYLQVEAVASMDGITENTLKEMLQEVANLADQFEMKLTGADVH